MIASKAELLDKLRTSGDQVVSKLRGLPPESFEQGRYESGWNGRQILAHIASIEWTYPRLIDVAREAQSPKPAEAPKEASAEPATRRMASQSAGAAPAPSSSIPSAPGRP